MDVAQPPEEDQLGGGKADGEEDDDLEEQGELERAHRESRFLSTPVIACSVNMKEVL